MTTYSQAYQEALASVPSDNPIVETLSIEHPDEETLYLVRDFDDFTATLEDGLTEVTFRRGWFSLRQPAKNQDGIPELQLAMSNVDGEVGAYLERIKTSQKPVEAVIRPYLADDTSAPAMVPPLRLQIRNVSLSLFQAQGRAVFARDLKNTMIPKPRYTLSRFPGLGS